VNDQLSKVPGQRFFFLFFLNFFCCCLFASITACSAQGDSAALQFPSLALSFASNSTGGEAALSGALALLARCACGGN
jgi:hypothetical protein